MRRRELLLGPEIASPSPAHTAVAVITPAAPLFSTLPQLAAESHIELATLSAASFVVPLIISVAVWPSPFFDPALAEVEASLGGDASPPLVSPASSFAASVPGIR